MKNLLRAAGALTLGAVSISVATPTQAAEGGNKPWTISAALRGFYDDNIYTAPSGTAQKIDSFGFDISPSLGYGRTMDNTSFSLNYTYLARWFEARTADEWDQNHNANLLFSHEFSPRVKLDIADNFIIAQDPAQFGALSGQVFRSEGDNINNSGTLSLSVGITSRFSTVLSYRNNLYRYDEDAYAASLDRLEHLPAIDFRILITPSTSAVVGYQYGIFDYDSGLNLAGSSVSSDTRDFDSHYIYGGVDHAFSSSFVGKLRAGAQITDYELAGADTQTTPYVDASLAYTYAPNSTATAGVRHTINATDVAFSTGTSGVADPVLNQESTAFYVRWDHAFTGKLKGGVLGQFQNSVFNGGYADGSNETIWTVGATTSYSITSHVALEAAYYYDKLNSDINGRTYGRNRVFVGVRASF